VRGISNYLSNPEDILELIGYEKNGEDCAAITLSSEALDFERLKEIAVDCLMASQECLVSS